MIEPVLRDIELPDGGTKAFMISKFDALSGREIVTQYPTSGLPKIGDYRVNEEIMLKMMTFVTVKVGELDIALTTQELVKNHVPDWETLGRLEWALMEYNCSFFSSGAASNFLEDLAVKVPKLIVSMLTDSLQQFSEKDSPPSES